MFILDVAIGREEGFFQTQTQLWDARLGDSGILFTAIIGIFIFPVQK